MFDIDANLEANDRAELGLSALRHRSRRLRFLPGLVGAEAYTGEIYDSIDSSLAWSEEAFVYLDSEGLGMFLFLFHLSDLNVYICMLIGNFFDFKCRPLKRFAVRELGLISFFACSTLR